MRPKYRLRQILEEYRVKLEGILGEGLESLVLFGSQARGESVEGSDIDILCIMKGPFHYGDLINRTSQATAEISLKYDIVISRSFITRKAYNAKRSPFLMNVHKDQLSI